MSNDNKIKKYYSVEPILSKGCQYNIIIGERSNGKTFSSLLHILKEYKKSGKQGAYVRRWQDDFKGKRGESLYNSILESGEFKKLFNDEWSTIRYYSGKWYLARFDDDLDKWLYDEKPFMYGFALTEMEHDKSTSYPDVTTIFFDEFLSRMSYLPDEFVLWMNVISTIIRGRNDVQIIMCGNTVTQYCPYFAEMGLTNIKKMDLGKIDIYTYGNSSLRVAVERCEKVSKALKKSDDYFAFDNPKLQMITGGAWEMDIYPHLRKEDMKYKPKDIEFTYFIVFDKEILQCEIISIKDILFTYIHRKTSPIKDFDNDLIYQEEVDPRYNIRNNILKPCDELGKRIKWFYDNNKVFYQDNPVGEVVRQYLINCGKVATI